MVRLATTPLPNTSLETLRIDVELGATHYTNVSDGCTLVIELGKRTFYDLTAEKMDVSQWRGYCAKPTNPDARADVRADAGTDTHAG